jgi:plastocyanin
MTFGSRLSTSLTSAHLLTVLALLLTVGLAGCQPSGDEASGDEASGGDRADETARTVVEMTARDYTYRGVPDSIPSGWTTLQLRNEGTEPHHVEVARVPDTVTTQDFHDLGATLRELVPKLRAGEIDTAEVEKQIPAWADSIENVGGLGHVSAGRTASLTLNLRPGRYGMLCYVDNPKDKPHWVLGMARALTVTTDSTGAAPPEAGPTLTVADYQIDAEDTLAAGRQTIAVHFGEVSNPEEPPYRDVELARLHEDTSLDSVAAWANAYRAPAPTDFLGGVIPTPAGKTAYLTVDLSPGRYTWVSHASKEKGMRKTFTVE